MKKWKQKLNSELDRVIPNLSEEVRSAPIKVDEEKGKEDQLFHKKTVKRWVYSLSLAVVVIVFAVCLSVYFGLRNPVKPQPQAKASYSAIVEINPKVMFSVGKDGKVTSVSALNADADVILSDSDRLDELTGVEVEKSIEKFVDYCAKLGYIDLDGESAVKISHSGKTADITPAITKVEDYFRNKGAHAVVFQKQVTDEKLCEIIGISIESTAEKAIEDFVLLSDLYTTRKWENMTDEELGEFYNDIVISRSLKNIIVNRVNEKIQAKEDIDKIYGLSEDIKNSPLNPQTIFTDYWSIKAFNENYDGFAEEFKWLMIAMDTAISEYGNNYGIAIKGIIDLETVRSLYSAIDFTAIAEALESVNCQNFTEYLPLMTNFLNSVGEDTSFVEEYLKVPKNKEEFNKKSDDYFKHLYTEREGKNNGLYIQERQAISQEEYADYVNSIISSYGSMELYWISLQNKK